MHVLEILNLLVVVLVGNTVCSFIFVIFIFLAHFLKVIFCFNLTPDLLTNCNCHYCIS